MVAGDFICIAKEALHMIGFEEGVRAGMAWPGIKTFVASVLMTKCRQLGSYGSVHAPEWRCPCRRMVLEGAVVRCDCEENVSVVCLILRLDVRLVGIHLLGPIAGKFSDAIARGYQD